MIYAFSKIGTTASNGFYLDEHSEYIEINLNDPNEFPFALAFSWFTDLTNSTNVTDVTAQEISDFMNSTG